MQTFGHIATNLQAPITQESQSANYDTLGRKGSEDRLQDGVAHARG